VLQYFKVDGFKSLKSVSTDFGLITILIGLNGSGKSSLLQALSVLSQSLGQTGLKTDGPNINLGTFDDIVCRGMSTIRFSIGGVSRINTEPLANSRSNAEYGYSIQCDKNGVLKSDVDIKVGTAIFSGTWKKREGAKSGQVSIGKSRMDYWPNEPIGLPLRIRGGNIGEGEEEKYQEAEDALKRIISVVQTDLQDFFLVPASRGFDVPNYPIGSESHINLSDSTGTSSQAMKLASTLAYKRLEERISPYIERVTGIKVRHRLIPDKKVSVETDKEVNIINEGFGTNQLVHLFAQIETSPAESLIAVEEPEIHLHPKAQADIADVLLDIARQQNKRLLISTHSEHFLFRMLTNIVLGRITPQELSINSFKLEKGFTKATKLKVDEKGSLSGGLGDFFETDLDELRKFLGASKS
jgi:energy-coupling factor transporter ATP-binding protein EcfA2